MGPRTHPCGTKGIRPWVYHTNILRPVCKVWLKPVQDYVIQSNGVMKSVKEYVVMCHTLQTSQGAGISSPWWCPWLHVEWLLESSLKISEWVRSWHRWERDNRGRYSEYCTFCFWKAMKSKHWSSLTPMSEAVLRRWFIVYNRCLEFLGLVWRMFE